MAINTFNKKLALITYNQPYNPSVPISNGGLDWGDKQHLIWQYPGILWGTSLQGSIAGVSGTEGSLKVAMKLQGFIAATSAVSGRIFSADELIGSTVGTSVASGSLNVATKLQGSVAGTSVVFGNLGFLISLSGSLVGTSGVSGDLNVAIKLQGLVVGTSVVIGKAGFIVAGFYESLANQITSYFQNIADENNLVVRYDNDLRSTPANGLWCEYNIDFGIAEQNELGVDSFRSVGNFNVKIRNLIGLGTGELFEKADVIADAFRVKNLNRIIFNVPRIVKVGKVEDDYQINVICPFFTDKVGK